MKASQKCSTRSTAVSETSKNPNIQESKHLHGGHRDRLRERFLAAPDALPDYELLELLLFMAIPRRDVKPIAKILIARFGNLAGVMNAGLADLTGVDGVSENVAMAIKTVRAAGLRARALVWAPVWASVRK